MSREKEVDYKMLKAFYFAYKDGTRYPSTIRDSSLKGINISVDEFIDSRRRLMQKELLGGTTLQTRGGTIWSPNTITKKGIDAIECNFDPLFRNMTFLNLGYSGKKYRFWKWFKKNLKWSISAIIGIIGLILAGISLT